jgi:NarL family two-component system response regulator LiaR
MEGRIRILLADDHVLLRQGTAELLRGEPSLEVVGEAGDGLQAVELTRQLQPDIVIMDVRMPRLSGLEATRRIGALSPRVRVLVLTAHDDDEYVFSLLQAGASGYLLKTAPVGDLVKAIRQVSEGDTPLDPAVARKVILRLSGEPDGQMPGAVSANAPELTQRELEVLQMVALGLSNRGIAEAMSISDRTVQTHLTNIFAKMNVASRVEAVVSAIRRGWVVLEG